MRKTAKTLISTCLAAAIALILIPTMVSAHGSITSNLSEQRFEVAPDRAEFVSSGPVDLSTAKAKLRYLGDVEVSTDLYFADDVPTLELPLIDGDDNTTFVFDLPELGAGTYALDWEVTPIGDHITQAIQLFVVTVGSPNPDPVPTDTGGKTPSAPVGTRVTSPADTGTSSSVYLLVAGAAAICSVGGVLVLRKIRR
jgi:LPXTG-motif cell wall-anchored protein